MSFSWYGHVKELWNAMFGSPKPGHLGSDNYGRRLLNMCCLATVIVAVGLCGHRGTCYMYTAMGQPTAVPSDKVIRNWRGAIITSYAVIAWPRGLPVITRRLLSFASRNHWLCRSRRRGVTRSLPKRSSTIAPLRTTSGRICVQRPRTPTMMSRASVSHSCSRHVGVSLDRPDHGWDRRCKREAV